MRWKFSITADPVFTKPEWATPAPCDNKTTSCPAHHSNCSIGFNSSIRALSMTMVLFVFLTLSLFRGFSNICSLQSSFNFIQIRNFSCPFPSISPIYDTLSSSLMRENPLFESTSQSSSFLLFRTSRRR